MKTHIIRNILLIVGIVVAWNYIPDYYKYFKYGERYNAQRNKYNVVEITDNLYYRNNSNNLRFSTYNTTEDFSKLTDSIGFRGHIDKFIFTSKSHYEEDVFIEITKEGRYFYRSYFYYDNNLKKCTLSKPNDNEGEKKIDCSIIDSLFLLE